MDPIQTFTWYKMSKIKEKYFNLISVSDPGKNITDPDPDPT